MNNGFSLIEVLIIVAVLSILCALTIPSLKPQATYVIQLELERLYAACNFLHHCACVTGKEQHIQFDLRRNCYTFAGHIIYLSRDVRFGLLPEVYGPPSKPYKLLTKPITSEHKKIIFSPDGVVTPGIICFVNQEQTILYALSLDVGKNPYCRLYQYDSLSHAWALLAR